MLVLPVLTFGQGREMALKEAQKHMEAQEYELARQQYKLLTDLDDRDWEAWKGKGLALFYLEESEYALSSLEKAQYLNKGCDPEIGYYAGIILKKQRKYSSAIAAFSKSLDCDSIYNDVYFQIGASQSEIGSYIQSNKYLKQQLDLTPNHAYANYFLARNYFIVENTDSCRKYIDRAIESNSKIPRFHLLKGDLMYSESQYTSALIHYNEAIVRNPQYLDALISRAVTYKKLEKYNLAIRDYDRSLELDPGDYRLTTDRLQCLVEAGRVEEAIDEYEKFIYSTSDGNPRNLPFFDWLIEKVDVDYEAVLDYAELIEEYRDSNDALNIYKRVLIFRPYDDELLFNIGNIEYAAGRIESALDYFDSCVDSNPNNIAGWYNKAVVLYELNKIDHACHIWTEIIEKSSNQFYVTVSATMLEKFCSE